MNRLFEPVYFDQASIHWDYRIRIDHGFKGYYHWHQACEFMLVHEGQGTVVVNQMTFHIRRGMFFFFPPFRLHQVYADVSPDRPYERSIFYADPLLIENQLKLFPSRYSRFEDLRQNPTLSLGFDLGDKVQGMEWIFEQYDQALKKGRGEDPEEIALLFLQMLNTLPLSEVTGDRRKPELGKRGTGRYSEAIMRWIEEHFHEEVSLERLAEELHLSPNYISRVFRQETGSGVTDYLTARRIKQACRLLETTDNPVEQVGLEAGFANYSYFIQLFKRVVGTTPLKYRYSRVHRQTT
ncbi:AraC family transcriptional regulator [Paenibacillus hamazuiensis]|uniref:AraC family transcriptional regulator n=1 Tax=Paenibacillus hamazuiensis TaxID=2936508 RepID=UPI00200CABFA|nr:AraC family transcriptional regulator [Paenibacillus hamazuiensis]